MLRDITRDTLIELRDDAEADLTVVVDAAIRAFLRDVVRATTARGVMVAAGGEVTLGELYGWWAASVDADITGEVRRVWQSIYQTTRDGTITATSLDALDTYMGNVTDRLVQGLTPPLPEAAFDRVRVTVTQAAAEGWSKQTTAARIANELAWETDGPYWRTQLASVDAQMDDILDRLGPPGNPVREAARLSDPRITALRAERNRMIAILDAEKSYWQNRASRIATTETTGAFNYGHLTALHDEGVEFKEWVATGDNRTRPTHAEADGQIVPIDKPFIVGGSSMMMPGDPNGGAGEVVGCRCVLTSADPSRKARAATPTPFNEAEFLSNAHGLTNTETGATRDWTALRGAWPDGKRRFDLDRHDRAATDGLAAITMDWDELRALGIDLPDEAALEWGAWRAYTGGGYGRINGLLRDGADAWGLDASEAATIQRQVNYLARQTAELPEDVVVSRGVRPYGGFDPAAFEPGTFVSEPGFTSTTVNLAKAKAYATGDGWVLRIRAKAGSDFIMGTDYEHEIIFPPGAIFRVLRRDDDARIVFMELVEGT